MRSFAGRGDDGCDSCGNRNSDSNRAYRELDSKLRILPFREFQQLVLLWLGAKGYRHSQSLGRAHRRGRRPFGGADFLTHEPGSSLPVAVQIRHWRTPVSRRAVDELWGLLLRHGIPSGLIVTNSTFSAKAIDAALAYPGRPIRFISRTRLVAWLISSWLGVRTVAGRQVIDDMFFRSLRSLRLANMLSKPAPAISSHFDAKNGVDPAEGSIEGDSERGTHLRPSQLIAVALTILLVLLLVCIGGRR